MEISIITVNLNNKNGLRKTIQSVLEQDKTLFEYIVVDGHSNDGSQQVIEEYENRIDRSVIEKDSGIYEAMNKGINIASGKYCLFLNSGDILLPGSLDSIVAQLNTDEDIYYADSLEKTALIITKWLVPEHLTSRFFYKTSINHQASLIKTILLKKEPYDLGYRIVSDWLWFYKRLLAGNSFKKLTGVFVEFNPEGLSRTKKEINIEERKKVIDLLLPKIIQREYDEYSQENEGIIRLARYIRLKKPGIYKKLNKMIDALIDLLGRKF